MIRGVWRCLANEDWLRSFVLLLSTVILLQVPDLEHQFNYYVKNEVLNAGNFLSCLEQYFLALPVSCLLQLLEIFVHQGLILWERQVPRDIKWPSKSEEEPRTYPLTLTRRRGTRSQCQKFECHCATTVCAGGTQVYLLNVHILWTTFESSSHLFAAFHTNPSLSVRDIWPKQPHKSDRLVSLCLWLEVISIWSSKTA